MFTTEVIMAAVNVTILTISVIIACLAYRWNDRQKKKDRALDLFKSLMTNEFLVKARLVSQEYLLKDPHN